MNYLIYTFVGIIVVFYYNTFRWLIESWINNPYYSHGIIVPIISGYIIWRMKKELISTHRKESQKGLIIFIIGLVLQTISVIYSIRFLSGLSLIIVIFGVISYLYGWELINKIKFPISFLLLAVPLPFVDIVAPPVQILSTVASSNIANMLGIPTEMDGLLLKTNAGIFEVALECSGLRSIISLLTLSIIYASILEGGILMKSTIVLSSIPLAIIGNVLRITSILDVANVYGKDVAINYFHGISNLLLFGIMSIGLFLVGRCFGRLKFKKL